MIVENDLTKTKLADNIPSEKEKGIVVGLLLEAKMFQFATVTFEIHHGILISGSIEKKYRFH